MKHFKIRLQDVIMMALLICLTIGFIGFCFVDQVTARPWLECDPYPAGSVQPDSFVIKEAGEPDIEIPAFVNQDGSRKLRWDLEGLPVGKHDFTIAAKSELWGVSAFVPFGFTIEVPRDPVTITIKSQ